MRIISGTLGGRRIQPPKKMPNTRPTTDLAKEGLFNTIQNLIEIPNADCLDLFGGTGCISYELFSRGAETLHIVEKDKIMYQFIQSQLEQFKIENAKLFFQDVFYYLSTCMEKYDIIFAGPPYALQNIDDLPELIIQRRLLKKEGIFILEHTPRNNYENHQHLFKTKSYGTTVFSFFQML